MLLPWSFPGSFHDTYVSHPDITPPLRLGVSTCQLCLVRVLKEEVLEQQCNIGEVPPRLPSILLHRVSQPFHQVLHSLSHLLNIQDRLDLILQMVILNRGRGRWWRVLRRERGGRYGVNNNSLNTWWIRHARGSLSRYPAGPTFSLIVKGPVCLLSSFLEGQSIFKFRVSSQTKSPLEYSQLGRLPTS